MLETTRASPATLDVCPAAPSSHPSPQPDRQREDPQRDLDCRHYDDCLDRAARESWPGFSCLGCSLMGRAPAGQLDVEAFVFRNTESDEVSSRPARQAVKNPGMTPMIRAVLAACPDKGTWGAHRVQERMSARYPYTVDQVRKALGRLAGMGLLKRLAPGLYTNPDVTKKEAS